MSDAPPPVETGANAKSHDQKWWITIATAMIAVSAPITTGVYTSALRDRELEVTRQQKQGELNLSAQQKQYEALDRAVDPNRPPEARRLVLRFLSQVPTDPELRRWAKSELVDVEKKLAEAYQTIAGLEKQLNDAKNAYNDLQDKLEAAAKNPNGSQRVDLQKKVRVAAEKQQEVQAQLESIRSKIEGNDRKNQGPVTVGYTVVPGQFNPAVECQEGSMFSHAIKGPPNALACGQVVERSAVQRSSVSRFTWQIRIGNSTMGCGCDEQ